MWERGRASQGQSRLFITTLHLLYNQFMRKGRATQGQSQLLAVPIASPKTIGVEEKNLFNFLIQFSCTYGMLKRYFQSVS